MHQLIPFRLKLWIVVVLGVIISAAAHNWFGKSIWSFGAVVGVVELIVLTLMARSWRWVSSCAGRLRIGPHWLRTDLSGEWTGFIQSQWKRKPKDEPLRPIPVKIYLYQRWRDVIMRTETAQMLSRSLPASVTYDQGTSELTFRYFFETEPLAASAAHNPPQQFGSGQARINMISPTRIVIRYTNERGLGGDIELTRPVQAACPL